MQEEEIIRNIKISVNKYIRDNKKKIDKLEFLSRVVRLRNTTDKYLSERYQEIKIKYINLYNIYSRENPINAKYTDEFDYELYKIFTNQIKYKKVQINKINLEKKYKIKNKNIDRLQNKLNSINYEIELSYNNYNNKFNKNLEITKFMETIEQIEELMKIRESKYRKQLLRDLKKEKGLLGVKEFIYKKM